MHAGNLVDSLKSLDSKLQFRGMGGLYSKNAGVDLALDYAAVSVMGFVEVLLGFRKVLQALALVKKDVLAYQPDAVILVDFGGFNMKIAAFATEQGIPVHYYIPPKVWAWNQKRALTLKANTDQVYSILPFEPPFFAKFGMQVQYVGNPLLDEIKKFAPCDFFYQKNELSYRPIVALLPGSRAQEVKAMLAKMIALVPDFPQAQFVVAGVDSLPAATYALALSKGIQVIYNQTYDLLAHATAAVVTSGTATLETALFYVPQLVVYKTSWISYQIGKRLIRVPYISLPNLIADKKVVRELIQDDFSLDNLRQELGRLLSDATYRQEMKVGYDLIRERIGEQQASERVAHLILESLCKK
ncbi:MAG: lipid-A-disaccharide synthase [Algoriphagus sp.]|nr:lipid-A-disaccharide synthase [Algoriphagus sp.]